MSNNQPGCPVVLGAAASTAAGVIGGPVAGAVVAFITGLPARFIAPAVVLGGLGAATLADPMTGIWLAAITVTGACGFILGALRKPPPGIHRIIGHLPAAEHAAQLEQLAATERARAHDLEQALLQVLATGTPPPQRGQLTT